MRDGATPQSAAADAAAAAFAASTLVPHAQGAWVKSHGVAAAAYRPPLQSAGVSAWWEFALYAAAAADAVRGEVSDEGGADAATTSSVSAPAAFQFATEDSAASSADVAAAAADDGATETRGDFLLPASSVVPWKIH